MPDWDEVSSNRNDLADKLQLEWALKEMTLSNAKLRAALTQAGKEIRKLNFGKKDTPVLQLLRREWREAKAVAAKYGMAHVPGAKRPDAIS